MNPVTLYTLGHGERPLDTVLVLLRQARIGIVVDIRTQAAMEHASCSAQALRQAIDRGGMSYHYAGRQLGADRTSRAESRHPALTDMDLRAYADYMDSDAFHRGVAQLLNLARKAPTAVLAADHQPDACTRSLIADYLLLNGVRVVHLIDPHEQREHALRPEARRESTDLVYDRTP